MSRRAIVGTEWYTTKFSPITGCLRMCPYCIGMQTSEMHGAIPNGVHVLDSPVLKGKCRTPRPYGYSPTFHRYRLSELSPTITEETIVAVCPTGEMFGDWIPDSWIAEVMAECERRNGIYVFCTQYPDRYVDLFHKGLLPTGRRFFYGSTMVNPDARYIGGENTVAFITPLEARFRHIPNVSWVVVGAERGKRLDRAIPKREWILEIADLCEEKRIPLFMENSVKQLVGDRFIRQTPWRAK